MIKHTKKTILVGAALLLLAAVAAAQDAPTTSPSPTPVVPRAALGDPAASLEGLTFIQGEPVNVGKGDTVYVVEFWATWCPPCRVTVPLLTKIQKDFKDRKVVVVGISNEDQKTVADYVKTRGAEMEYLVAVDKSGKTLAGYMAAYGVQGIPHAFIVDKEGRVVWHDHPTAQLDVALGQVLDGTYDLEQAKKREAVRVKQLPRFFALIGEEGKEKEAGEIALEMLEGLKGDSNTLNHLAWFILTDENIKSRNLGVALKIAEQANAETKGENPMIVDTYAYALFKNGKTDEAIVQIKKAIALTEDQKMQAEFKKRLEEFEKSKAEKK
jgi:thiol-disulfide isomerase/thioredoxin